jgi:hypothetical protein
MKTALEILQTINFAVALIVSLIVATVSRFGGIIGNQTMALTGLGVSLLIMSALMMKIWPV